MFDVWGRGLFALTLAVFCCLSLVAPALAQDGLRYECSFTPVSGNAADIPRTVHVDVPDMEWKARLAVDVAGLTDKTPPLATVSDRSSTRLGLEWSMMLRKGAVGTARTYFRMTVFPERGEATLSTHWGANWKRAQSTARGTCKTVRS